MRAAGLFEFGGPERLTLVDVPAGVPGPAQVRVRLDAVGVNPADVLFREGRMPGGLAPGATPPYVPGMDGSGVVEALGEGVDWPAAGDPVMVLAVPTLSGRGTYAESVVVPAASVVPRPPTLDHLAGATVLLNALTADLALDALGLGEGGLLLVTGATGGVGRFAVQLAKTRGLTVAAACAEGDHPLLQELGVDLVLSRTAPLAGQVRAHWHDGAEGVVDAAVLGPALLDALADGSRIAALRDFGEQPGRGIQAHRIKYALHATDTNRLQKLAQLAGDGVLTSPVAEVLPLTEAERAHRMLAIGGLRGRLVLVP